MHTIISRRSINDHDYVNITHMPRHIMDAKGIWYELIIYVHTDGRPSYRYIPLSNVEKMFKK